MPQPRARGPILITDGDAVYFPMIQELHQSIRAASPATPPALGVIDAGLTEDQVRTRRDSGAIVARPSDLAGFPAGAVRKPVVIGADSLEPPWSGVSGPPVAVRAGIGGPEDIGRSQVARVNLNGRWYAGPPGIDPFTSVMLGTPGIAAGRACDCHPDGATMRRAV